MISTAVITALASVFSASAPNAAAEAEVQVVRTTDNSYVFLMPDVDRPGHCDRAIAVFFREMPPIHNLPGALPAGSVRFSDHAKDLVLANYGKGMVIFGLDGQKANFWMKEVMDGGDVQQAETYLGYGISDSNGDWDIEKVKNAGAVDLRGLLALSDMLTPEEQQELRDRK